MRIAVLGTGVVGRTIAAVLAGLGHEVIVGPGSGQDVLPKIGAWYAYRSQCAFTVRGLSRLLPIWLDVSMIQFEYFAKVA